MLVATCAHLRGAHSPYSAVATRGPPVVECPRTPDDGFSNTRQFVTATRRQRRVDYLVCLPLMLLSPSQFMNSGILCFCPGLISQPQTRENLSYQDILTPTGPASSGLTTCSPVISVTASILRSNSSLQTFYRTAVESFLIGLLH